jgi:hypothetical protein
MKKELSLVCLLTFSNMSFANEFHRLRDSFGDWNVRHVYNDKTLHHRFSDAKTKIVLSGNGSFPFQINRDFSGKFSFIFKYAVGRWQDISLVDGWLTKAIFNIDGKIFEFHSTNKVLHSFSGEVDADFLLSVAQAASIKITLFVDEKKVADGVISADGSFAALNWLRAL